MKFRLSRIIHVEDSGFYKIIIANTKPLGRVLIFREGEDLTIQTAEKFDFYDEMLAHVPMAAHECPKKVLIIGGGDGIVVREVLKYDCVEAIHLVEIDPLVVKIAREYLKLDKGALSSDKVQIFYDDAAKFIANCEEKYDVIIGDYSDPYVDSPAGTLISKSFYLNLYKILDDNGVVALQAGSPLFQREIFVRIYSNVKSVFPIAKVFWTVVPYYPGGLWSFVVAAKGVDPTRPKRIPVDTKFYSEEIHRSAFVLPKFIKEMLGL